MRNPFADTLRRLLRRRRRTPPESQKPSAVRALSSDGLQIARFSPDISRMLRLYGVSGNYGQIYATQYNVRAAVDAIAREAATLTLYAYLDESRGRELPKSSVRLYEHPLYLLLHEPSPGMSKFRFWYSLFSDIAIYDVAYWYKVRQRGLPKALIRVPPSQLVQVRNPNQTVTGFRTASGQEIPRDNFVTFWGYDPNVDEGSISPMESIRRLIAEEVAAGMDREGRWRNSARKDGVIERDLASPMLDDDAKEGFLIDVEDALGGAAGSGRPLILQPGMTWNDVQWSPREMEYIEARKLSRSEVASFFHMPSAMMAAAANGNEPDKETLSYFYTSTLPPWLVRVEHEIEAQLLPEFERSAVTRRDIYCEFNLDEKLRGSFEERVAILATAAGGPILTVNEARTRENMPAIDGGDLIFVPLNSVRAGGPQGSPRSPVETPAEGVEPAGTTPGGGTVSQASLADVRAGSAVVLGSEAARAALSPDLESIDELILRADAAEAGRKARAGQLNFLVESREKYEARARQLFLKTFERQKSVVSAGKSLKRERWDRELADDAYGFLYPAVGTVGENAAKRLNAEFDHERTSAYVQEKAQGIAERVNAKTEEAAKDGEDPFTEARAERLGKSLVTWVLGWAVLEAAHQANRDVQKTWHTTNPNARPSHAALNGESVESAKPFSNGLQFPGDASQGGAEVAGCSCLVTATGASE